MPDPEDPERPGDPAAPRLGRAALPWLLGSALLLLLLGGGAFASVAWTAPPAHTPTPGAPPEPPDRCAHLRRAAQAQYGQLVAENAQLTEGPLSWYSLPGLANVYLSPGLSYDPQTQELVVAEAGTYYVYLQLDLRRVLDGQGSSSSVSSALHLRPPVSGTDAGLALTLDLPPPSFPAKDSVTAFQGTLLHLEAGHRLAVHLGPLTRNHSDWQLAQGATIWGLFQVASGGFPSELTMLQPTGHPSRV